MPDFPCRTLVLSCADQADSLLGWLQARAADDGADAAATEKTVRGILDEVRQDGWQPCRQHGLSRTGRAVQSGRAEQGAE